MKILCGLGEDQRNLYLIGFGDSYKYRKANINRTYHKDSNRIPNIFSSLNDLNKRGSFFFNQLINIALSRKDDLESLGYVLLYLASQGKNIGMTL